MAVHRAQRDRLRARIIALGGEPGAAAPAYVPPFPVDDARIGPPPRRPRRGPARRPVGRPRRHDHLGRPQRRRPAGPGVRRPQRHLVRSGAHLVRSRVAAAPAPRWRSSRRGRLRFGRWVGAVPASYRPRAWVWPRASGGVTDPSLRGARPALRDPALRRRAANADWPALSATERHRAATDARQTQPGRARSRCSRLQPTGACCLGATPSGRRSPASPGARRPRRGTRRGRSQTRGAPPYARR